MTILIQGRGVQSQAAARYFEAPPPVSVRYVLAGRRGKAQAKVESGWVSLWSRLFGKSKEPTPQPAGVRREIPDAAMQTVQVLRCDPNAGDPDRFSIGEWGLTVTGDESSHRLAKGVLKKSAGKTLRLEPNTEVGHRGVISSATGGDAENAGYKWLYVDVDLRAGSIRFHQGGSEVWPK